MAQSAVSCAKVRAVALVVLAEAAVLSVWFSAAAVLPDMAREAGVGAASLAHLSTAVQAGFVIGALVIAIGGIADRYDGRRVFALFAMVAAASNIALLMAAIGGAGATALRMLAGAALAGVYPVGMKLVLAWADRDRGLLVGLLVGALTLGTATPHALALAGGAGWRSAIVASSVLAVVGGLLALASTRGPATVVARKFDPRCLGEAWTNPRLRLAYAGYFGHMWELYAVWAWMAVFAAQSLALGSPDGSLTRPDAERLARLVAIVAITGGGLACAPAGWIADRIGKARVAQLAMLVSAGAGLVAALSYGAMPTLFVVAVVVWGIAIVPDSAQFSALVAEAARPETAGSLLTLQTALGFALTLLTVQGLPWLASSVGWPSALAVLAIGPLAGAAAMQRLIAWQRAGGSAT